MIKTFIHRLRVALGLWLIQGTYRVGGGGACANRSWKRFTTGKGKWDITIIYRNTEEGDGYERTELYRMLLAVRTHERIQGWTCPEPTEKEIQSAAGEELAVRLTRDRRANTGSTESVVCVS